MLSESHSYSLSEEAQRALNDRYPDSASGKAALATAAVINHRHQEAKPGIALLESSAVGVQALIVELGYLANEGWYRSFSDLLGLLSSKPCSAYELQLGTLVQTAHLGMLSMGVHDVESKFRRMLVDLHTDLTRYLHVGAFKCVGAESIDSVVHTLRDAHGSSLMAELLASYTPTIITQAFNSYVERGRFAWAGELLDFCYQSEVLRLSLLRAAAIKNVVEAMQVAGSVVSMRYLAQVVQTRPEYRRQFCEVLKIPEL